MSRAVRWFLALFLGLVLVVPPEALSAGQGATLDQLIADRSTMADTFLGSISDCVERRDTDAPLFHGCSDWSSAVEGYWALVAMARVTHSDELLATVREQLTPELIAKEQKHLADDRDFAMPYGRAWLLRLAMEFERAGGDARLKRLADDAAQSIVNWFGNRRMDQLSSSERSDTWPLVNLRAYGRYRADAKLVAFVDDKVRPIHIWPCEFDADELVGSFMGICTTWAALVGESRGGESGKAAIRSILPPDGTFRAVAYPHTESLFGLDFSRAWGLWRLWRLTGEKAYLTAYTDHVGRAWRNRDWWEGDYQAVGHWVPQLGVLALLPLFDADYE
jgi:Protein of unknown function (DUF2891)